MTPQNASTYHSAPTLPSQSGVQRARVRPVQKPWGTLNLLPWSRFAANGTPVGELWFDRTEDGGDASDLLIKLLFTEQRLSVQVHPDDTYARSLGQPNGKTEAWYILSAQPGAQVGLGLTSSLSASQLRAAILDGSVADLVDWRPVATGDVIFVPAGTIHAIGPGLVIAEIQQRSDTTYRLFDYGRGRALDMERAIDVADAGPAKSQQQPDRLNATRTILVDNALFVIERITLAASLPYQLTASGETWIMGVDGSLKISGITLGPGEVAFMNNGGAEIVSDLSGAVALVIQAGPHTAPSLAKEPAQQEILV